MATPFQSEDCIITERAGIIDSGHVVHAAIADTTGKILYPVGNPHRVILARPTVKPAQALAVLETRAFDQFGFDDANLALMCASHNSESRHISRANTMLAKVGAEEGDLACGGHPTLSSAVNRAWIKSDYVPSAVCNSYSGKHAGMMGGAKAIGATVSNYHRSEHPMQLRVKQVFDELYSWDTNGPEWGVDRCNPPAPAAPLHV
ncbi:hypothetical protein BP5796_11978 [Coleophoma crateriformis]|uniref:Asparaginase n=1 Tax=Coleophoma crateriformis TaxID=565419 RepID=A0A3D8QC73_9HELO|nr:hypothetical protein BP5796_11978 [Coleophoma crateriformis]